MSLFINEEAPSQKDKIDEIDSILMSECESLGILDDPEISFYLNENYGAEVRKVKLSKSSKFQALFRRTVLAVARSKKDPSYDKFVDYRRKAETERGKMTAKYKNEAMARTKEIITAFNKQKGRDIGKKPIRKT